MLSVIGPEKFYYLRNFHDLRCKYARVLSVIRQQMNRLYYDVQRPTYSTSVQL